MEQHMLVVVCVRVSEGKLGGVVGVVGERSLKTCTDNDLANAVSTPVGKLVRPAQFRVLPANRSDFSCFLSNISLNCDASVNLKSHKANVA